MSSAPPTPRQKGPHPAAPQDARPGDSGEDDEVFCAMLDEILQIGMQLTRLVADEAAALGSDKASIAFDRVTRAIRRTMLLSKKLTETRRPPTRNAPTANAKTRNEARAQIGAQVGTQIGAQLRAQMQQAANSGPPGPGDSTPEPNDDTAPDRLDSIGTGTIPEIIASLCKDLASAATALGKPTQRALLLATTSTTPTPGQPAMAPEKPSPASARRLGEGAQPNPTPNPARYRGSG